MSLNEEKMKSAKSPGSPDKGSSWWLRKASQKRHYRSEELKTGNRPGRGGWVRLQQYLYYYYYYYYFSILDIMANLKFSSSTFAHASVYRIRMPQSHPARHCLSTTAYPKLQWACYPPTHCKKRVSLSLVWAPAVFRQFLLGHSTLYYHVAHIWFPYMAIAL